MITNKIIEMGAYDMCRFCKQRYYALGSRCTKNINAIIIRQIKRRMTSKGIKTTFRKRYTMFLRDDAASKVRNNSFLFKIGNPWEFHREFWLTEICFVNDMCVNSQNEGTKNLLYVVHEKMLNGFYQKSIQHFQRLCLLAYCCTWG